MSSPSTDLAPKLTRKQRRARKRRLSHAAWRPNRLKHLPGADGWPIIGQTFEYLRDQPGWAAKHRAKYGPIYRTNAVCPWRENEVVLHTLLRDRERIFSSKWGWDNLIGRFFGRGLMLRDFDDHKVHRRIMQAAFTTDALRSYLDLMNPAIVDQVPRWGDEARFRFYPAVKKLTLDMAGVVFTGLDLGDELSRMNKALVTMMRASFALVPAPIPGTLFWRGVRSRRHLEQFFGGLIPTKRASDEPDMLSALCHAESEDGERLSDRDIVDHMIFLMLAAHDTTTSALTNCVWALAEHRDWQERLRAGFLAIDKPALDYDDLADLTDVELVLKETLRLHPPVSAIPRMTLRDTEIEGALIPEKTVIWLQTSLTHRLPEYWSHPDTFDPDRFADERAEHKQHPGLFAPYSSGAHICLGMLFSIVQVKAVLNTLLRDYELELPEGYAPRRQMIPFPKPTDDLPVRLIRRH